MKSVVVTGSGGPGCGRAIASRFARDGASVVISDIDDDAGLETLRQIQAAGYNGHFWPWEVASLLTFPERGLAVAVMSNVSFAGTPSVAERVAEAFAELGKSPAGK